MNETKTHTDPQPTDLNTAERLFDDGKGCRSGCW